MVLVGCGGSGAGEVVPPPDPTTALLVGNWISTVNASCAVAFDATATDFVFAVICVNADLSANAQVQKGTYSLDGASLVLANSEATCVGTEAVDDETVSLSATSLVMTDSAGEIAYVRNTAPAGSQSVTYGCFSNGTFTASPLAPL